MTDEPMTGEDAFALHTELFDGCDADDPGPWNALVAEISRRAVAQYASDQRDGMRAALRGHEIELDAERAKVERLRAAFRCFLDDGRFTVSVGGNPDAVEEMLREAWVALIETDPQAPLAEPENVT